MRRDKAWPFMALAALLWVGATGCGREDGGQADTGDELEQELKLALQGDTGPAVFEDTSIAARDEAVQAEQPPPPSPPRQTGSAEPAPRRPEPRPVRTAPERSEVEPPAVIVREPEPRVLTAIVPIGTTMSLTLDEQLSTETSRAGDAFSATLQQPVYDADGTVLIPTGAAVRGRVTHVQKSGHVGETALLNVAFEAVSWGDSRYPLEATVVQANPERVSRSSTAEQIGKVAAGAAAGAILGRVIGGKNRDAVKGAVVGAAAGTAIALGTADVDAVLKAGSLMVIRTDQPLEVVIRE